MDFFSKKVSNKVLFFSSAGLALFLAIVIGTSGSVTSTENAAQIFNYYRYTTTRNYQKAWSQVSVENQNAFALEASKFALTIAEIPAITRVYYDIYNPPVFENDARYQSTYNYTSATDEYPACETIVSSPSPVASPSPSFSPSPSPSGVLKQSPFVLDSANVYAPLDEDPEDRYLPDEDPAPPPAPKKKCSDELRVLVGPDIAYTTKITKTELKQFVVVQFQQVLQQQNLPAWLQADLIKRFKNRDKLEPWLVVMSPTAADAFNKVIDVYYTTEEIIYTLYPGGISLEDIDKLCDQMDENKDGTVSPEEWKAWCDSHSKVIKDLLKKLEEKIKKLEDDINKLQPAPAE